VTTKSDIFWAVMPCSLVGVYWHCRQTSRYTDDGGKGVYWHCRQTSRYTDDGGKEVPLKCWYTSIRLQGITLLTSAFFTRYNVPHSRECSWPAQCEWRVTRHNGQMALLNTNHCQGQQHTTQSETVLCLPL